jgi:hypothetical protein
MGTINTNPSLINNNSWRFEFKYHLSLQHYYRVKSAIRPYLRPDDFTMRNEVGHYFVRSLYFDSSNFHALQEKIDGVCDRTKLRIRTYSPVPKAENDIRVEMKARKGITVEKRNTFISLYEYNYFMNSGHWPTRFDPVLVEFERYIHLKNLKPQVLIEYMREGFISITQNDLRITFDKAVKCAASNSLFPANATFRNINNELIVLEIKCNNSQPPWLLQIVRQQGLRIVANSKFAQGIQLSRPEIIQPSWSY